MFLDDLNKLINNSFAYSNVNTTDLKSIDVVIDASRNIVLKDLT